MRWTFPQDRLVYTYRTGSPLYPVAAGTPLVVYLDQACTQLATDLQQTDGTAIANATVFIGDDTLVPLFLGPAAVADVDVTELWGLPAGAPEPYRLDAVISDRLEQIEQTQSVDVTTLVRTNDARLTDSRTPLAHGASHHSGGTDAIAPSDIGAAPTSHTHSEAQVTGLVSDLSNKAAKVHTHAQSDITGLGAALGALQPVATKGQPNGYTSLDSGGKVPLAQLPTSVTTPVDLSGYQRASQRGAVNGYASLGSDGKVPTAQLPSASAPGIHSINGLTGTSVTLTLASLGGITSAALSGYQALTGKGVANGYAALDSSGKVPAGQLPAPPNLSGYVQTSDSRLSNARTPTAHAVSHHTGGSDALTAASIGAAATVHTHQQTDIVNLTASLNLRLTTSQADSRYVQTSTKGAANGIPSLDGSSKIPVAQIPDLSGTYIAAAALTNYQRTNLRGVANGYAALDAGAKVPVAQLPDLSGTYATTAALAGYQAVSGKNANNGYAGLDSGGKVGITHVPDLSGTYATLAALAGYQIRSDRNATNGYAGLDANAKVSLAQIPDLSTNYVPQSDSRLTNARTPLAHAASHHTGGSDVITPASIGAAASSALASYQLLSSLNVAGGYAGLDSNAKVALANLPIVELDPGDEIPPDLPDGTIIIWRGEGSGGGGVPAGGTAGQIIVKNSSTDYDAGWHTLTPADIGALSQAIADLRYVTSVNGHSAGDVVLTASELGALSATDPSVTNARTPTAHAASHAVGGSDVLTPAAIGALTQAIADGRYLQAAPVTSVNTLTGDVVITAAALGAITQSFADGRYLRSAPVNSVNGKTGTVVLAPADIGAVSSTDPLWSTVAHTSDLAAKANTADLATVATSGDYNDLINAPATGGFVLSTAVAAANGVASLDSGTKVPAAQIPSTVGFVIKQASDGTWPTRTTATSDANATVFWVAYATGLPAPTAGGAYFGPHDIFLSKG